MTVCRSSFFFDETRSSSPWTCARTPLGPSSLMILETFFAFSWVMPSLRAIEMRYSLPDAFGSAGGRRVGVRPHAAEVEPVADFLRRLVQRVVGFLAVDLADDVKAGLARHDHQVRRVRSQSSRRTHRIPA